MCLRDTRSLDEKLKPRDLDLEMRLVKAREEEKEMDLSCSSMYDSLIPEQPVLCPISTPDLELPRATSIMALVA
jgi:hypothetical protein